MEPLRRSQRKKDEPASTAMANAIAMAATERNAELEFVDDVAGMTEDPLEEGGDDDEGLVIDLNADEGSFTPEVSEVSEPSEADEQGKYSLYLPKNLLYPLKRKRVRNSTMDLLKLIKIILYVLDNDNLNLNLDPMAVSDDEREADAE
jgi:hypothetical protein